MHANHRSQAGREPAVMREATTLWSIVVAPDVTSTINSQRSRCCCDDACWEGRSSCGYLCFGPIHSTRSRVLLERQQRKHFVMPATKDKEPPQKLEFRAQHFCKRYMWSLGSELCNLNIHSSFSMNLRHRRDDIDGSQRIFLQK